MTLDLPEYVSRIAAFENEAHELLSASGSAPSRVLSLSEARKQVDILNFKQDELLRESMLAVQHGLFRSSIVMAWAAFMDFLMEKMTSDGMVQLRLAYPAWAKHTSLEELRESVVESQLLDAARKLKLLSKAEHKALHGLLSKRNEAAHPSDYSPVLNEVLGYLSELLNRMPTIGQRSL